MSLWPVFLSLPTNSSTLPYSIAVQKSRTSDPEISDSQWSSNRRFTIILTLSFAIRIFGSICVLPCFLSHYICWDLVSCCVSPCSAAPAVVNIIKISTTMVISTTVNVSQFDRALRLITAGFQHSAFRLVPFVWVHPILCSLASACHFSSTLAASVLCLLHLPCLLCTIHLLCLLPVLSLLLLNASCRCNVRCLLCFILLCLLRLPHLLCLLCPLRLHRLLRQLILLRLVRLLPLPHTHVHFVDHLC